MKVKTLKPAILTLITTYRCTSACPNCCFNCSPNPIVDDMMSLDQIKYYLDSCVAAFPSLKVVVFTGGECTLLGTDLLQAISYAKNLGLSTRVVTNGHWGKDMHLTSYWVNSLIDSGLDEINFSTGDEHSLFVSLDALTCAVSECAKKEEFKNVLINIELSPDSVIDEKVILGSKFIGMLTPSERKKICCVKSPWIEFRHKHKKLKSLDNVCQRPCRDVLTSINISPQGVFLSCCGLASEYSPILKLGTVSGDNILELHNSRFEDLLKLWLFSVGPLEILKELDVDVIDTSRHGCEYCMRILKDREVLLKIMSIDSKKIQKIFLDYNIIASRYE